ncbi:hypothetical protein A3768_4672 (plasmid) [Ralstonia solanacearum]|nr:hypothetical protein A3768_4672 [Ralstonia solanacearum]
MNSVWSATPGAASTAAMLCPAFTSRSAKRIPGRILPGQTAASEGKRL